MCSGFQLTKLVTESLDTAGSAGIGGKQSHWSWGIKTGIVGLLWLHPLKCGGNSSRIHDLCFIQISLLE